MRTISTLCIVLAFTVCEAPSETLVTTAKATALLPPGVYPIAGESTDLGDDDLAPFAHAIEGKTVVGLGESIHGVNTSAQLCERLIRYLVRTQGFRAVSFEGWWYTAEKTRAWVERDEGSLEDAVKGLTYLAWQNRPTASLLSWLHRYNLQHPDDPVHLFGADVQDSADAAGFLRANLDPSFPLEGLSNCYCGAYDSADACASDAKEVRLLTGTSTGSFSQQRRDACLETSNALRLAIDARQAELVARLGEDGVLFTRLAVDDLTAFTDAPFFLWHSQPIDTVASYSVRDVAWGAHFLALRHQLAHDAKTVVWAHNYHLSKRPEAAQTLLMWPHENLQHVTNFGRVLRASLQDQYAAFGLVASRLVYNSTGTRVEVVTMNKSSDGELALANFGQPRLFVTLPNTTFPAGHTFSFGNEFDAYEPADEFDGLFYFEDTSASIFWRP